MPIDRSDPRPLYAQIAATLRAEIRDRAIAPGDTLPSEAALRERFGVSRSVIRQALSTLEDEGVVRRDPGRAPVAASGVEHRRLVQRVTGLFDQFSHSGLSLGTSVARLEPATAPSRVARHLGTRSVLRLERVRSVDEAPLSYVRTWLPADRVPGLTAAMLTDASLHRLLESRFGAHPISGRRQIRAVPADAAIAAELEVAPGSPLLLLEGSTFDQHGAPLEWFESWHRSDRVVFDIEADETTEQVRIQPHRSLLGEPAEEAGEAERPEAERPEAGAPAAGTEGHDRPADLRRARELLRRAQEELDRLAAEER
ncbi:GntR family transcriptional regulator [Nocardiopsis sediminis]|uniref:GntR family transcriptional regulator n=1 Tax=Nocardiopsis sediminis TaxID=1778267 RepID=A0ABV8FRL5_9ACTN